MSLNEIMGRGAQPGADILWDIPSVWGLGEPTTGKPTCIIVYASPAIYILFIYIYREREREREIYT